MIEIPSYVSTNLPEVYKSKLIKEIEQLIKSGKLQENDVKDLPICRIPVLMAEPKRRKDKDNLCNEDCVEIDIKMKSKVRKSFSTKKTKETLLSLSGNDGDDSDFVMKDNLSMIKEKEIVQQQFKSIGLSNVLRMAKNYGINFF